MFLSAIILSALFCSIMSAYMAIIMTNNSSSVYKIIQLKNYSPVKIYLWAIIILNLSSIIIFFIFGLIYINLIENFSNALILYLLITFSLALLIFFIVIMIKGKLDYHLVTSVVLFTIIISGLYPILLNRVIN